MVFAWRGRGRPPMSAGRVICVVGPTAVGKSEVAELVACEVLGEVVSVDSMQVYRHMDIGTAKRGIDDRMCPLHMVDVVDITEPYSVALFQQDARRCVDWLLRSRKVPVLCGGTGLYLDAVIDDMTFPVGETSSPSRSRWETMAAEQGPEKLHHVLQERDPASAKIIHPHNVRRVIRALEMHDQGISYARHHEGLRHRKRYYDASLWALMLPREDLYRRINRRVDYMFDQGLVDEVRMLRSQGLENSVTACKAIGYAEVLSYLDGAISLDETVELVKRNSRRYAKRQLSWIKRDGRAKELDMSRLTMDEACKIICDEWRMP